MLKSARAWRLKMALRAVYANAVKSNDEGLAKGGLKAWLNWAKRSCLEPLKKLGKTLPDRLDAVVRGMVDNRSNAYVKSMNGLLQQAKRAARGFRSAKNFIGLAYLQMSKLKYLTSNSLQPASAQTSGAIHRCA